MDLKTMIFFGSVLTTAYTLRANVKIFGPTEKPGFRRLEGKASSSCPLSHLYPFNNFTQCCESKNRSVAGDCPNDDGEILLLGSDPDSCCDESVDCELSPCRMHEKGFERKVIYGFLVGRSDSYTWRFDPKERKFRDVTKKWPLQADDSRYMQPGYAAEYPVGSGKAVVCGGVLNDPATLATVKDCYTYDFIKDTWTDFSEMLEPRGAAFMMVDGDGILWILGSFKHLAGQMDTTEYYDEIVSSWKFGHPLPDGFSLFGAVKYSDNEAVLAGGVNSKGHDSNKVFIFNVQTGNYIRKKDMPHKWHRFALGVMVNPATSDRVLVATVGRRNGVITNEVDLYDFGGDEWKQDARWTVPGVTRYVDQLNLVTVSNQMYLFGGYGTADVYRFDGPDEDPVWTKVGALPQSDHIDVAVLVTVTEPY